VNAIVLDAGAFIAAENNDRSLMARLRVAQRQSRPLRTSATSFDKMTLATKAFEVRGKVNYRVMKLSGLAARFWLVAPSDFEFDKVEGFGYLPMEDADGA
jgi:hypothetical protein